MGRKEGQLEYGTVISVEHTKPYDPGVQPLILLTIGDTMLAMSVEDANRTADELQKESIRNPGEEQSIVYKMGANDWQMSGNAALRMAAALRNEIAVVLGGV